MASLPLSGPLRALPLAFYFLCPSPHVQTLPGRWESSELGPSPSWVPLAARAGNGIRGRLLVAIATCQSLGWRHMAYRVYGGWELISPILAQASGLQSLGIWRSAVWDMRQVSVHAQ